MLFGSDWWPPLFLFLINACHAGLARFSSRDAARSGCGSCRPSPAAGMEAAAAAPHLLHCGGFGLVAHLPVLPGRRQRRCRGQFPRVRVVATEPKPSTSTSSSRTGLGAVMTSPTL